MARAKHLVRGKSGPKRDYLAAFFVVAVVALACVGGGIWHLRESEGSEMKHPANEEAAGGANTAPGPASQLACMLDEGQVSSIELVGDSITAGYGTDGYVMPDASTGTRVIFDADGRTEYETPADVRCWANDLRAYAASRGVPTFTNRGICGWTMHDLVTYEESYVDDADVIVCMLGTNDTVNHSLETFRQDAATGLAYLAAHCRLLVVMTPPETDWTQSGYRAYFTPEDTARVLDEVCGEAGYLHISNLDVIRLDSDLVNADNVHPTTKGSDAIWRNMCQTLGLQDAA